ncbi:MAG: MoxR family ATPase [Firmicutes bacterium]|nr:MoxR family ATPase [Bacillota bacterium]
MKKIAKILTQIQKVFIGKEEIIYKLLTGILSGGHILIEDVPGVGKTTLAHALAKTLGCSFARIQFTPDLMPADVIGISVFEQNSGQFVYRPGPIMHQIVLADEINRTSPRTQASLLEAMAEGQVSVDGKTYPLPSPFFVLATQNPVEYEGTYPLPEAQLDRFMLRISLGYPDFAAEKTIMKMPADKKELLNLEAVITPQELLEMQKEAASIFLADTLEDYIVQLTRATREHEDIMLGISPRGAQHLYRAAKALAYIKQRDYVLPDDIKEIVTTVFAHRLVIKPEALLRGKNAEDILQEILHDTYVPVVPHGKA